MRVNLNLKLNQIESKLGCPYWKISGLYFWPAVRLPLVWYLESVSLGSSTRIGRRLEFLKHLGFAARDFVNNLMLLPRLWRKKEGPWLIDNSNTLVIESGQAVDRSLSQEDEGCLSDLVLEVAGTFEKRELSYRCRKGNILRTQRSLALQFIAFRFFLLFGTFRVHASELTKALCDSWVETIRPDALKIERILANAAAAVWAGSVTAKLWKFLLPRPSRAFIVSSYSPIQLAFLQCLQFDGIPVEEIQHGLITAHHPGYTMDDHNYPSQILPGTMHLFGKGWLSLAEKEGISLFAGRRCEVLGVPWIAQKARLHGGRIRVLVTSQEILREDFDAFMEAFVIEQTQRGVEIVIRAHPSDGSERRRRFQSLVEHYPGVSIDDPSRSVIVSLRDGVTHHCSVFSTCLFEANSLGILNLVPKVTFSDMSRELVLRHAAAFIDPSVDLKTLEPQDDLGCFEPYRRLFA